MNTIEIPAIKFKALLPAYWDELTSQQYRFVVDLYLKLKFKTITIQQFKEAAALKFLNVSLKGFKKLSEEAQIEICSKINQLSELFNYFFYEEEDTIHFNYDFTKNCMPVLKAGMFKKLYGPDDAIMNLTFAEYIDAYTHYTEYKKTNNSESLNNLVAVLYRAKRGFLSVKKQLPNFNGQIRVKYNANKLSNYVKHVKNIPFVERYGVFLWFNGCENHLKTGDLTINGSTINLSVLYKQGTEDESSSIRTPNLGLISLLYSVAEARIFGDIDKTSQTNIYDVFVYLFQKHIEAEKLKQQYKNR